MKTVYEFHVPALCSMSAVKRLRGRLNTRTGLVVSNYDLDQRVLRLVTIRDKDLQLRELLGAVGFPPEPEDPEIGCLHRTVPTRPKRDNRNLVTS